MADTAREVIEATRRSVDRAVAAGEGPELVRVLAEAQQALDGRIGALRHLSDERWTSVQTRAARGLVEDAIILAKKRLEAHITRGISSMAAMGGDRTLAMVQAAERQFAGVAYELPFDVALRLNARLRGVLATRLRQFPTSVDRYGLQMIGKFESIVRSGIMTRQTVGQIIDRFVSHRGPRGPEVSLRATVLADGTVKRLSTMSTKKGLFVEDRYWAERIVRTEMLYGYNAAAQATIEEMAVDDASMKRIILAHFDQRTGADSIFVHGEIRGPTEPFVDGAGRVYLHPPARPNDREIVVPHRTSWPTPRSFLPVPAAERTAAADDMGGTTKAMRREVSSAPERQKRDAPNVRPTREVTADDVAGRAAGLGTAFSP